MTEGICPFAEQLIGRESLIGYAPGYVDRVGFCDHTAGGFYSTMRRWTFWNDPNGNGASDDAVSVHFAISRKGEVLQVLNIFDTAFAQGRLTTVSWPPYTTMGQRNPNGYLISTEHEDVETVNGQTVFIPGSQWTQAEYDADLKVKRWCIEECKKRGLDLLKFGIDSLAGHHMFDPVSRAECPGKYWRDEYHQKLFNDLTVGEDMYNPVSAWADFFYRNGGLKIIGNQQINTNIDFGWPLGIKCGLIQFHVLSGSFEVYHGNGDYAASVGWNQVAAYQQDVIVQPDGAGWITLTPKSPEVWFFGARGLGYWT